MKRALVLIASACALALLAPAQSSYPATLFHNLRWVNLGPGRAGRSIASAGSAARPLEYYAGATGGGLWKTTDGGLTWKPVTDGQLHSSSVGAVAVAPSNPDVVYIGMGESALRGNIMQGDGVYKTSDGGKTWQHVGLADSQIISSIRIDPANPDIVYVAALGHPSAPNAERGVFKSTDGGKNWKKILYRNDQTGAIDLALDPRNPQVIYAALWQAWRKSWGMASGGPGSGLFKSTDGGGTWKEITRNPGLPTGVIGKIGITVSGVDSNRLYALVEARDGGVFRSDDAGATWKRVNSEDTVRQRAFYFSNIFADPQKKDVVYAGNVGFYKSTDGGVSWKRVRGGDTHAVWIDPNNDQRMVVSNDSGATVTTNDGQSWSPETYSTAQLYHVALTKDDPYQVCGAQQDDGTICVQSTPPRRFGGSGMWAAGYDVGGGESGYIAPSPTDPNIFYAGSQGALLSRCDRRSGECRDVEPYPRFFSGEPSSALPERWQWTFPIVFDNFDAHILYTSSQHLWMTTDEGQSWTKISPDLTLHDPATLGDSGGPITHDMNGPEVYATIFTIAPSHKVAGVIWTGSDDGLIYITRNRGKSWTNVTPPDMPHLGRVSLIEASPTTAGTAYAAVERYLQDDRAPYIFRTTDFGKSWTKIVKGIAPGDYVHAVRADLKRPGLLYAGTEHGIYISFDNGDQWQSLRLNMPDEQVSDIELAAHDVVISTMGRGFWSLRNMDYLRQLTPAVASADAPHLFTPRAAARGGRGLTLSYYLPEAAHQVKITILDANGRTVQTYTSAKPGKHAPAEESFFRRAPAAPATQAGISQFTWDLRYPGATTFKGMVLWGANITNGPIALPGGYRAELSVDGGAPQAVHFTVLPNPHSSATMEDLKAQFDLDQQVVAAESRANQAVIDVRALRPQVQDRIAQDAALKADGDALVAQLTNIEHTIYQTKSHASEDPLNFPIKLNNRIGHLMGVIEGSYDARPTDQTYAVVHALSTKLEQVLARFQEIQSGPLAAFNRKLVAAGEAPVKLKVGLTK
ncbi:MAG: glycosyl hydrolase [Acidobacteria bacterium]|nr:MAG: glycosyl hydrolase [Acidobacteriota bacterium]